jgi:hypothetical protein
VRAWLIAIILIVAPSAEGRLAGGEARNVGAQDLDRDGLPDHLEQTLLERFAPTLLLAHGECDGVPASFMPNTAAPRVRAKDATLYGQAFPIHGSDGRAAIELHFFHLWANDCGRLPHRLDAEHVSAIVSASRLDAPAFAWIAEAWYAAAHEGSVCDASSGAPARVIGAEVSGPRVFVSRGKHASYFDRGQCKWGCGGDECGEDRVVVAARIINLGEIDAPLNGATWARSTRWPMREKFQSDFDPALRARLDADTDHVIPLMQHWRGPQAPVLAGDTALDGLETAAESAGGALVTATRTVGRFLRKPLRKNQ